MHKSTIPVVIGAVAGIVALTVLISLLTSQFTTTVAAAQVAKTADGQIEYIEGYDGYTLNYDILEDKTTGVDYLVVLGYDGVAVTPLVDKDGTPR